MTTAANSEHEQDADCTVDPETNLCVVCGVEHAEPCPDCGGRGFHKPDCPVLREMAGTLAHAEAYTELQAQRGALARDIDAEDAYTYAANQFHHGRHQVLKLMEG